MITQLTPVEARALGALVEKSLTVKEQYPLTFNSLLLACNQKSSRDPVMELDTETLGRAVQSLVVNGLAERIQAPGDRVPKFRHYMGKLLDSDDPKLVGVITVLLLRGPQTAGEIKGRTERLCEFASTAEVEGFLHDLSVKPEPFVAKMPKQHGQKEGRYAHLFCGAPSAEQPAAPAALPAAVPGAPDRVELLERRVAALEALAKDLAARLPAVPEKPAL